MSDAQSRWENQRDIDCAEHGQAKCPKFPDHDCEECHAEHKEDGVFNEFCDVCLDERCTNCNGTGWIGTGKNEEECGICEASGRVEP